MGSPVSPSVEASWRELSSIRSTLKRVPMCAETSTSCSATTGPGGRPSGAVMWSTPTGREATVTGTHSALSGPPGRAISLGQALIEPELSNTLTCPRRSATHASVVSTGHAGEAWPAS